MCYIATIERIRNNVSKAFVVDGTAFLFQPINYFLIRQYTFCFQGKGFPKEFTIFINLVLMKFGLFSFIEVGIAKRGTVHPITLSKVLDNAFYGFILSEFIIKLREQVEYVSLESARRRGGIYFLRYGNNFDTDLLQFATEISGICALREKRS
jgi:hypothetical protein